MKHWSKATFRVTERTDWGYQTGYCAECQADMAVFNGKVRHYGSHKNARRNGITITKTK